MYKYILKIKNATVSVSKRAEKNAITPEIVCGKVFDYDTRNNDQFHRVGKTGCFKKFLTRLL